MTGDSSISEIIREQERVYDGSLLKIEKITATLPNGKTAYREVVRHVGACAVLPLDGEGYVYMERQYRTAIDRVILEIPAGKLNGRAEDRLLAAKRELREETGITAGRWDKLGDIVTTPGFSDEVISLFLARDLEIGETEPDEDEFLHIVRMPFSQLLSMISRGEIEDGKTISAAAMAMMALGSGRLK